MSISRRLFLAGSGASSLLAAGSMAQVIAASSPAKAQARRVQRPFAGYGPLVPDPKGVLDLPQGFQYRVLSREGDAMRHGLVPSGHDGMAAFPGGAFGTWLVRNHE